MKTRQASTQLAETRMRHSAWLNARCEQLGATWCSGAPGQLDCQWGVSFLIQPERPSLQQLRNARSQQVTTQIEGLMNVPGGTANCASTG
jgi:hypothetical protein